MSCLESQQLAGCNVSLRPPKWKRKRKKSRILSHIWHTLEISTFRLQMKSATCETERARLQIPCAVPISAPEHDNVSLCRAVVAALFSGFLLELLSFFFFRRCESSLHNKYRKGVLVCVCEMWRVCVQVCLFFFCLTSLQNAFWVGFSFLNNPKLFERSKKNSLLHIIWFSHIFPRSFLSLWQLSPWQTHNFLLKPCDEWKMRPHGVLCKKGLRGKSSFAIERQRLSLAERTPGPFLPTAYQVQSWRGTSGCFFFFCFFCHAEVKSFTSCCYSFSSRVNKFHPVASE